MRVLGIDTSTMITSVAVVAGSRDGADDTRARVLAEYEDRATTHSDNLIHSIDRALAAAGVALSALDGIAVGAGPGSFTGLRIGMATGKGLAFAAGLPLWAVSSLAALALGAHGHAGANTDTDTAIAAVADARRREVFCGCYRVQGDDRAEPLGDERVLPPARLRDLLSEIRTEYGIARFVLVGDGLARYADQIGDTLADLGAVAPGAPSTPRGAAAARLALAHGSPDVLAMGAPVYIRPAEAEIKYPDGNPGGTFSPRG